MGTEFAFSRGERRRCEIILMQTGVKETKRCTGTVSQHIVQSQIRIRKESFGTTRNRPGGGGKGGEKHASVSWWEVDLKERGRDTAASPQPRSFSFDHHRPPLDHNHPLGELPLVAVHDSEVTDDCLA